MRLPSPTAVTIYAVTETVGTTGVVTESVASRGTVQGYLWNFGEKWGHRVEGNKAVGAYKMLLPRGTTVLQGDLLDFNSVRYRAVTVHSPGGHHVEVTCDRV